MVETKTRVIDADGLLRRLDACFAGGGVFPLTVTGTSMCPFLRPGRDQVTLAAPDRPLRRGDVALFLRPDGSPVLHRVVAADGRGLFFLGDGQLAPEGPVPRERVLAVAVAAQVNGRLQRPGCLRWEFFRRVWIHPWVRRAWAKLRRR